MENTMTPFQNMLLLCSDIEKRYDSSRISVESHESSFPKKLCTQGVFLAECLMYDWLLPTTPSR